MLSYESSFCNILTKESVTTIYWRSCLPFRSIRPYVPGGHSRVQLNLPILIFYFVFGLWFGNGIVRLFQNKCILCPFPYISKFVTHDLFLFLWLYIQHKHLCPQCIGVNGHQNVKYTKTSLSKRLSKVNKNVCISHSIYNIHSFFSNLILLNKPLWKYVFCMLVFIIYKELFFISTTLLIILTYHFFRFHNVVDV